MALNCDAWRWITDAHGQNLEFEMEYVILKHPDARAVGITAVEVYQVDFDFSQASLKGRGTRIYKRGDAGPPVERLIGLTPVIEVQFDGDTAALSTNETRELRQLSRIKD